jgi:hypothetical protein
MPVVQPPKERHSTLDDGVLLKFTIPSRKNFFISFALGLLFIFLLFGNIVEIIIIITGIIRLSRHIPNNINIGDLVELLGGWLIPMVVLIIWTLGSTLALNAFLWHLAGKENIEVSYKTIKIQNTVFGFGRTKEYLATHVRDLRVSPLGFDGNVFGWSKGINFWCRYGGLITFDYGAKTFHFGCDIDEAEAKQILEKILIRFPSFESVN